MLEPEAETTHGMRGRIRNALFRRVVRPILSLLTHGITPERISFCLALGFAIAICPILGVATLFCTLAAAAFRLNLPLIQSVNYAATPLQLSLILPYIRAGERLFGGERMAFSLAELFQRFEADWTGFFADFWVAGAKALGTWLLTVPLIVAAIYLALTPVLRRLGRRVRSEHRPLAG